ncbi:hypothetical protein LA345_39210 (plasmid) [Burkholderia vietnamiensis]|nr:hypothetical protein [Burkholderia vietnamiensis]
MKLVALILLLTAAVEFACAAEFRTLINVEDACNVDDAAVCTESLAWLDRE